VVEQTPLYLPPPSPFNVCFDIQNHFNRRCSHFACRRLLHAQSELQLYRQEFENVVVMALSMICCNDDYDYGYDYDDADDDGGDDDDDDDDDDIGCHIWHPLMLMSP
jgi:hypothetical protein